MISNKEKKVVIVTGASRGIGKAIKENFEAEGHIVFSFSRNGHNNEYEKKCDIRSEKEVELFVDNVLTMQGKIDFLINNAGIVTPGPFSKTNLKDWNNVIATNLTGAYLMCKNVLPSMKKKKFGKIVNISSVAARSYSLSASAEYTASKYALIGLTKQLAYEYGKYNININCICPSQTRTDMLENFLSEDQISKIEQSIPLKKIATPKDIAGIIIFLCSNKSSYMQGSILDVNGGQI
tara:strand:- start:799 stop:1509 length:711 start_codon:yes stop_codon:yes gene_type:complete